jgi:thioredoxin-dependent peroxiredoxin
VAFPLLRDWLPILLAGVTILGATACGQTRRPDGEVGLLPVGSPAPDFEGEGGDGKPVRLSDVRGKVAAVYFYPKDDTPGCTKQACAFRDAFDRLAAANVVVFGISRDSAESHRRFRQKHALPFPLVADEPGDVARAYGVPMRLGMTSRVTFLVDVNGTVARVWPDVDPAVDAKRVLEASRALTRTQPAP